ncbi:hypothetical protein B0T21DRAFT_390807 [Apiosordaria backusii]|uniref:G-protein coupled receptors family 2 profile 2 domain-containing protein n=1 Tax=Apiosordaria backusii TaxID=314023 RepID=A0AA40K137_9PEZI|nr:hypothetical protein B0T21DRAFT_390807 [Apiosordaria backusii]
MPVIPFFLANTTTLDTAHPLLILTEKQTNLLATIERALGSVSLAAVTLIFVAFALFRPLRTVPNCFLVCSSAANFFSSVATLMAHDGLRMTVSNGERGLCNAQGFLFQTFLQSDPWWSFAMAVNVLIIFRYGANPRHFKRWWWLYCLICYGGPGVSAGVLLALGYYGNAGIWCWIDSQHKLLRIYTQYLPVWICILGTLLIYLGLGIHAFRSRNRVDKQFPLRTSLEHPPILQPIPRDRKSFLSLSDWPLSPFTSSALFPESPDGTHPLAPMPMTVTRAQSSHTRNSRSIHTRPSRSIRTAHSRSTRRAREPVAARAASVPSKRSSGYMRAFGLNPRRAPSPPPTLSERDEPSEHDREGRLRRFWNDLTIQDTVKRSYLQTSGLFAFAILATWIPSSIFRVKQILYRDANFPAYAASAAALSMQGVWNFLIFFLVNRRTFISCARNRFSSSHQSRISTLVDGGHRSRPVTTIHAGTQTELTRDNIGLAESADIAIETKSIRTLPDVTEVHQHSDIITNPMPLPEKGVPAATSATNTTTIITHIPTAHLKSQPSKRSLRPIGPVLKEKLSSSNIRRDLTVRIPWRSPSRTSNWSLSTTGRNKKDEDGTREGESSQRSYSWDFLDIGLETRGNILAAISSRGTPTGSGGSPVTLQSRASAVMGHSRGVSSPC